MPDYAVTAEFYDLLQADEFRRVAAGLLDRWLGEPRVGVVDAGAGTGIATVLLAGRSAVTVHAVEPSPSMRAVLLSRLAAAASPDVRVHARTLQESGLVGVADFALCLNTMGTLSAAERAAGLDALARAVVPDGTLVVQRPPDRLDRERYELPRHELGGDVYGAEVSCATHGDRLRWRFTYRVSRDGAVVREAVESFDGHLVPAADFDAELRAAGFAPVGEDAPDVVVARRVGPAARSAIGNLA